MNPFDAVGTARISAAIYDRMCRLSIDYQDGRRDPHRAARGGRGAAIPSSASPRSSRSCGRTREHPDVRIGSSVRGAIDLVLLGRRSSRRCATRRPTAYDVGLDAALAALSGRLRVYEGASTTATTSSASCGRPSSVRRRTAPGETGKRLTPLAKGASPPPDQPLEGDEARERLDEEQRGSTPRRQLENAPHFDDVSPAVGVLDEDGVRLGAGRGRRRRARAAGRAGRRHRSEAGRGGPAAGGAGWCST